jgi:regulator of nonsense transcripts 2
MLTFLKDAESDGDSRHVSDDEEEDVVIIHHKETEAEAERNPDDLEAEDIFDREFQKLMTESLESRKFERKTGLLDVPIPMHLLSSGGIQDRHKPEDVTEEVGRVAFTLLTKKGNKQMV